MSLGTAVDGNRVGIDECDHAALVADIPNVLRLPISDRLDLAKRRRTNQTRRYERWLSQPQKQGQCQGQGQSGKRQKHSNKQTRRAVQFDATCQLLEAAHRNDLQEVREILRSQPSIINNYVSNELTALHQATIDGNTELVRVLVVEFGANVNCSDVENWSPLHTAALCGYAQITQILINSGANLLSLNVGGHMPYDLCDDESTLDIIESEMAKQGVTQEMINELRTADEQNMLRDLQRLSRDQSDLEFRGQHGETPLHVAASNGFTEVAEFLLSRQVSVDVKDNESWQPIHCAAHWKQTAMVELLVRHGADLNATITDGLTPCDLCSDDNMRQWMLELRSVQDALKSTKSSDRNSQEFMSTITASYTNLSSNSHIAAQDPVAAHASIYSSNLSLADKSTLSSSLKRLNNAATEKLRESREESQLWSSMQSLAEEEDGSSGSSSGGDGQSRRILFTTRDTAPPSIDAQLQSLENDIAAHSIRLKATSPTAVALANVESSPVTVDYNNTDDAQQQQQQQTELGSNNNWQLRTDNNSNNSNHNNYHKTNGLVAHIVALTDTQAAKAANGPTENGNDNIPPVLTTNSSSEPPSIVRSAGRGLTSAEMKKQRAQQRQSAGQQQLNGGAGKLKELTDDLDTVEPKKEATAMNGRNMESVDKQDKFDQKRGCCVIT